MMFTLPTSTKNTFVLLVDMILFNPIATQDVVQCVHNVIAAQTTGHFPKRSCWISTLTGPDPRAATGPARLCSVTQGEPCHFGGESYCAERYSLTGSPALLLTAHGGSPTDTGSFAH